MADYHLHLHAHAEPDPVTPDYSLDRIEQYVEVAAARGIHELCFTEHYYRCVESESVLGRFWEDETPEVSHIASEMVRLDRTLSLEGYVGAMVAARDAGLPIRVGLELDFFPDTIEAAVDQVAGYPFDFIVGAIHWVGGLTIDMPATSEIVAARGLRSVWEEYAGLVAELGLSGHVDAVAHIDVLKKYGLRLPTEPLDLYSTMIEALAAGGVAMEVNTGGLRKPADEIYPTPTLLAMAHAAGIPITFGSDGHRPAEVGQDFEVAHRAARAAGYTHSLRFERRRAREVPFDPAGGVS